MKKAKHARLIPAVILCVVLMWGLMPAALAVADTGLDKNEIFEAQDIKPADVKPAAPLTLSDGQKVTIDSAGEAATAVLRAAVLHGSCITMAC